MASENVAVSFALSEIPEEDRTCRPQICRISPDVADRCHLSLGQCIRLTAPHTSVICRVFPSKMSGTFIQYDACVTDNVDASHESVPQEIDICPLDCSDGKEVCVKLIVKDIYRYRNSQTELATKCLRCLRGMCVTPGCVMDLTGSKLAKLYGISCCLVLQCFSDARQTDTSSAIKITEKTIMKINATQSWECYELVRQTASETRETTTVSSLERERNLLTELLLLRKVRLFNSQGVLLWGPPGCGKTSLVRQVARDCQAALLMVSGVEVLSSDPGESERNMVALFDRAVRVGREALCLLFLDEADGLCARRGRQGSANAARVTTALLTQLDRVCQAPGVLVVMATNRPSALDPDIRRCGRLDREIIVPVPTSSQRREIFNLHLRKLPLAADLDLERLSSVTPGYVGADIEAVCREAQLKVFHQKLTLPEGSPDLGMEPRISQADLEAAILSFKPSLQRGVESVVDVRTVLWSDVGGLDQVKLQIQQAVEWPMLYPETFQALGLPLPKGILLYGPPGCGKTTLVQAAATACRVTFLTLSCAQLYSPYVGDSEKKMSETFQKARDLAPSILFLDEVDSIVGKRSEGSGVSERVLSALLNEMDGVGIRLDSKSDRRGEMEVEGDRHSCQAQHRQRMVKEARDNHVLVVAATNRPDMLDAALLRPGRMDRLIYIPPPDTQGRLESFRIHGQKMPLADDVDFQLLADATQGYTGADIRGVCKEAALLALRESMEARCVGQRHLEAALAASTPSLPSDPAKVEAMCNQFQR